MDKATKALFAAAASGNLAALREAIDAGADLEATTGVTEATPLFRAVQKNQSLPAEALLKAGANPRHECRLSGYSISVLNYALYLQNTGVAEALLNHDGALVNEPDGCGWRPLHLAVHKDEPDLIALLLASGADPALGRGGMTSNGPFEYLSFTTSSRLAADMTPLMGAVGWKKLKSMRALVAAGVRLDARTPAGNSALVLGEGYQPRRRGAPLTKTSYQVVAYLLAWLELFPPTADLEGQLTWRNNPVLMRTTEPLLAAARKQLAKDLKGDAKPSKSNKSDEEAAKRALEAASMAGDVAGLRAARAEGLSLAEPLNKKLETPLHLAARGGHRLAVEYLLQAGADPLAENKFQFRPLAEAVRAWKRNLDTIRLLAPLTPMDELLTDGCTPLVYAASVGSLELIEIFVEAGAPLDQHELHGQILEYPVFAVLCSGMSGNRMTQALRILFDRGAPLEYEDLYIGYRFREAWEKTIPKIAKHFPDVVIRDRDDNVYVFRSLL
ncbi:MAG: ankyrin repeat domain-containing protein [Sumerlaeia bacterium]